MLAHLFHVKYQNSRISYLINLQDSVINLRKKYRESNNDFKNFIIEYNESIQEAYMLSYFCNYTHALRKSLEIISRQQAMETFNSFEKEFKKNMPEDYSELEDKEKRWLGKVFHTNIKFNIKEYIR